ncbi:MAG: phenylalanine--tRNA ligase subunit beta [candidate division Zixibacteria bacterium]|nr:phenylalanine--tRNA ligase subunit beta [candidate division Zixibacteria bacterium]
MKVSYKWLKELVDFNWSAEELADKLTFAGLEVESIEPWGTSLDKVIVGQIKKIEKPPDAEKLSVCQVDAGREVLQVICGAKNVKAGMKAPLALIGAKLPAGLQIEKATLKGIESSGMLCSEKELGIGEESEIIMVLEDALRIGDPLSTALDLEDFVLDIDITPNRPDALSMIGIARDVSALSGGKLKKPEFQLKEIEELASQWIEVVIDDPSGCPRYAARVIKNVKIVKSPFWLRRRLECCGMRAINNVVDATNYVLLETGHPLHAFDYNLFTSLSGKSKRVQVRRAKDKEKFFTLDGVERTLSPEVLLITDGNRPVAIAGIMGGMESEVTEKTKDVLLESAYFDPRVIRRGRISLGLITEASYRFERGADPNVIIKAADRASYLMQNLCEGKVLKGVVDNYPKPLCPVKIPFRPERCSKVLGIGIGEKEIENILGNLELKISEKSSSSLLVEVPTFRPDLAREIDLIEEIARIYGYDKIESSFRAGGELFTAISEEERRIRKIKSFLTGRGLFEVISNNLVDPIKMSRIDSSKEAIRILNPLNEELSVLTTSLSYNLLSIISWNLNRKEKDLRIFELGKVFWSTEKKQPEERLKLEIALCGRKTPVFWGEEEKQVDFYDLKGVLEDLLRGLRIERFNFSPKVSNLFSEGMSFELHSQERVLGSLGKVSKEMLKLFDLEQEVFLADIDFQALSELIPPAGFYTPLPKFPRVERDISMLVDEDKLCADLEKAIIDMGGKMVEKVYLFDLYRGSQVPKGKKSLAYAIWYRSEEKTLTDEEVEEVHKRIIEGLKTGFGAELRE